MNVREEVQVPTQTAANTWSRRLGRKKREVCLSKGSVYVYINGSEGLSKWELPSNAIPVT